MNDMQLQAQSLLTTLQQDNQSGAIMLGGSLGVFAGLNNTDNGTRALILLAGFIAKYGEVLDMALVAHQEIHQP